MDRSVGVADDEDDETAVGGEEEQVDDEKELVSWEGVESRDLRPLVVVIVVVVVGRRGTRDVVDERR